MTREQLIADLIPKLLHDERHQPRWPMTGIPIPNDIEIVSRASRMADQILAGESPSALSKLACEAADTWVLERDLAGQDFSDPHRDALDRLEVATRQSPLRKVIP